MLTEEACNGLEVRRAFRFAVDSKEHVEGGRDPWRLASCELHVPNKLHQKHVSRTGHCWVSTGFEGSQPSW